MQKYGDGRVALIGFPSVGKSTLLTQLTGTKSEAANYEFTTLTCIPGVIHYNDAKIQLLDLPGIIEGAAEGKGALRGYLRAAQALGAWRPLLPKAAVKDERPRMAAAAAVELRALCGRDREGDARHCALIHQLQLRTCVCEGEGGVCRLFPDTHSHVLPAIQWQAVGDRSLPCASLPTCC